MELDVNESIRKCRVQGAKCRGIINRKSCSMNKLHVLSNAIGNHKPNSHDPIRNLYTTWFPFALDPIKK